MLVEVLMDIVLKIFFAIILLYITGAFAGGEVNPFLWKQAGRLIFVLLCWVATAFIIIIDTSQNT